MKKVNEFEWEETSEEWLWEGYKVVSMRRNVMFRMLLESTRLLLFGNAGGTALIIGFMSTAAAGGDEGVFHWLALVTVLVFGVGGAWQRDRSQAFRRRRGRPFGGHVQRRGPDLAYR